MADPDPKQGPQAALAAALQRARTIKAQAQAQTHHGTQTQTQTPRQGQSQVTPQSFGVAPKCSFAEAFLFLEKNVHAAGLSVKYQAPDVLVVDAGAGKPFDIHCKHVPCFVETIPEMLTIYIVAQLLKIASVADVQARATVADEASTSINAKIVVLQQMNKHFSLL